MPEKALRGIMWSMKTGALTPKRPYRNRFCGLPNGMSMDPRTAAIFSREITGRMKRSLSACFKRVIVRGTKIIRETSLVTNMEVKNTPNTRNRTRPFKDLK